MASDEELTEKQKKEQAAAETRLLEEKEKRHARERQIALENLKLQKERTQAQKEEYLINEKLGLSYTKRQGELAKLTKAFIAEFDAEIKLLETKKRQDELTAEELARLKHLQKEHTAYTKSLENTTAAQKKLAQEVEAGDAIFKSYGNAMVGLSGPFERLYKDYIPKSAGELRGFAKVITDAHDKTSKFHTGVNLAGKALGGIQAVLLKVISNTVNFALGVDKATAAFQRATGAGTEYNAAIASVATRYGIMGISAEESGAAAATLYASFQDFTTLNDAERENMIATTSILAEMGVSAQTTAKNLDFATKSMGMTAGEAGSSTARISCNCRCNRQTHPAGCRGLCCSFT